ncbi:MAG: leucine-rich repeat protein [Lachnospiraceae bacterium]|nr:leucine-rich repeat protein [Lachnospiraceae bacterium]
MKKSKVLITLFLLSVTLLSAGIICSCKSREVSISQNGASKEGKGELQYTPIASQNGYSVSLGTFTGTVIEIPSKYKNGSVIAITARGFANSTIESVKLPSTVKTIGDAAFQHCFHLKEIVLPYGLKSIEKNAFEDCVSLTSLSVPSSVSAIGSGVFGGCGNLTEIQLPFVGFSNEKVDVASKNTLFGYAFGAKNYNGGVATTQYYNQNSSQVYYLPEKLTAVTVLGGSLLYGAFYNCNKIIDLIVKADVDTIDDYAFFGADSVKHATMPVRGFEVLTRAKELKNKLTNVTVAGGNTVTPKLFFGCDQLAKVVIGEGEEAFSCCFSLTSLTLSNELETIGSSAFSFCANLNKISFGNGLQNIGDEAFAYCGVCAIVIPPKVRVIGNFAFLDCTDLESIVIGSGVQFIGYQAFKGCTALANAYFINKTEWVLSKPDSEISDIDVTSEQLTETSTAVKYLTTFYSDYYWIRG